MEIIHKARGNGKTRDLIEHAAENSLTIVCLNQNSKIYAKQMAKDLGLEIPEPVTVEELRGKGAALFRGRRNIKIAVDDADAILENLLQTKIHVVTISRDV